MNDEAKGYADNYTVRPSHSKLWVIPIQVAPLLCIEAPGGANNENQIDFVWAEDCWRPQTEKVVSCQA